MRALAPRVPRASRRGAVARSSNAVVAAQAAARARLERAERIAAARLTFNVPVHHQRAFLDTGVAQDMVVQ